CHSHEGTTKSPRSMAVDSQANFAPDLSRIAAKIKPEVGEVTARRWLIQWLLNPNVYHPRTRMPITYLKVQDAADIAARLLSQPVEDWKGRDPKAPKTKELVALARVYLAKAPGIKHKDVDDFLPTDKRPPGIPAERLADVPRDADELRLKAKEGGVSDDDLKWYVGRKTIGRLGCYGCHDIPGFETAKPIGTGLNDWGKKDAERLAFEDAEVYVKERHTFVEGRMTRAEAQARIAALIAQGERMIVEKEREELNTLRAEQVRVQELE